MAIPFTTLPYLLLLLLLLFCDNLIKIPKFKFFGIGRLGRFYGRTGTGPILIGNQCAAVGATLQLCRQKSPPPRPSNEKKKKEKKGGRQKGRKEGRKEGRRGKNQHGIHVTAESTKNLFSACLVVLLLSLRQFRVFLCLP